MDVITNKIYTRHTIKSSYRYAIQRTVHIYICTIMRNVSSNCKAAACKQHGDKVTRCAWNNATVNKMIVIYERINFRIFPIAALIRWSADVTRRGDDAWKIDKARIRSRFYWIQNKIRLWYNLQKNVSNFATYLWECLSRGGTKAKNIFFRTFK